MYSALYSTLHSTRHCNAAKGAGGITHNGMNAATLLWLQHYAQHLLLRLQPFLRRRGMRLGDLRWCAGGHYIPRTLDGISDSVRGTRGTRGLSLLQCSTRFLSGHHQGRGIVLWYMLPDTKAKKNDVPSSPERYL